MILRKLYENKENTQRSNNITTFVGHAKNYFLHDNLL